MAEKADGGSRKFGVAITGDTGYDLYTHMIKGYVSPDERVRQPLAAFDYEVPSGVAFSSIMLRELLPSDRFEIIPIVPKKSFKNNRRNPAFSTLPTFLFHLDDCARSGPDPIFRVKSIEPLRKQPAILADGSTFADMVAVSPEGGREAPNTDDIDLLVIYDGAGSWRKYPSELTAKPPRTPTKRISAMDLVDSVLPKSGETSEEQNRTRVVINISHDLPSVEMNSSNNTLEFAAENTLWRKLAEFPENVCVICSADLLRRSELSLSRRLSWEQTLEDFLAELQLSEQLRVLSRFKHLIVRFGMVGVVHVVTDGRRRQAELIFAPLAKDMIYRDPTEDGDLIGNNVLLSASIVNGLAAKCSEEGGASDNLSDSLRNGMHAITEAYKEGYKIPDAEDDTSFNEREELGEQIIRDFAKPAKGRVQAHAYAPPELFSKESKEIFGRIRLPCAVLERSVGRAASERPWKILRDALDAGIVVGPSTSPDATVSRINLGIAIAMFGHRFVLNREFSSSSGNLNEKLFEVLSRPPCRTSAEDIPDHLTLPEGKRPALPLASPSNCSAYASEEYIGQPNPIYSPIREFGKLTLMEREEIESFHSIRNLMKTYLENRGQHGHLMRPISVAVFGPPGSGKSFSVKQIARSINESLHHRSHGLETIEYNVAQLRGIEDLGSACVRVSSINNDGKVPLVFFDEFDCQFEGKPLGWLKYFLAPMNDGTFYGTNQTVNIGRAIFVFAGGIYSRFEDFAGAGRGNNAEIFEQQKAPDFISRLSGHINVMPVNAADGETKQIIRRAITLRSLLEDRGLVIPRKRVQIANVDEDIIYAMLTIDRYRHGMRSMEAVLKVCNPMEGRIEKASLPSRAQLDMHVDAEEFFVRMFRGRSRRTPARRVPPASIRLMTGPSMRAPKNSARNAATNRSKEGEQQELPTNNELENLPPPRTKAKRKKSG
jgi:hypothetical protein